jgi:hypothetical protein
VIWAIADLTAAGNAANVAGMLIGLAGLVVSAYGVMPSRRTQGTPMQSVSGSTVGGHVVQLRKAGSVLIGLSPAAPSSATATPAPQVLAGPATAQSVTNSHVDGSVIQASEISNDINIRR